MSRNYDVIIIGAGINGLVCANILAKNGRRVLMLEANPEVGGMASTHEFAPGFKVSSGAHLWYGMHPNVYRACGFSPADITCASERISTLLINQNKEFISYLTGDRPQITYSSSLSTQQHRDWEAFHQKMKRFSTILFGLSDQVPPRLKQGTLHDMLTLVKAGMSLNRLGKHNARQFLRVIGMNMYDFVDENFTSDLQKAAVCFESILGTRLGPRAPNTVFNWLNRYAMIHQQRGGMSMPTGGMGALCCSLADKALGKGVEIAVSCKVGKILLKDYRANGVELLNGDRFSAHTVVSNVDAYQTCLDLVGAAHLDTEIIKRLNYLPHQGSTCKVHLALSSLPESITHNENDYNSRIIFAPDADYIERASNAMKYQQYAAEPVFEVTFPSFADASLAPAGKHVMSGLIPYVPYAHEQGWNNARRHFTNHILEQIERVFPGIHALIEHVEVLLPVDIERRFNSRGGHWHHCEPGLERFLMLRPLPAFAQYQTSITGLFLCGADCHPGGDVNGVAGMNAAQAVLNSQ